MGYNYKLVSEQERSKILTWLILSGKLIEQGTQFINFLGNRYRITYSQTYSGLPDPTVEEVVSK